MSSLVAFVLVLFVLAAVLLAVLIQLARRPNWGRLVLAVLLTRVFDRPEAKRQVRLRP